MKFLLLSLVFMPFMVLANGGQNQTGNPIFGDDCVSMIPPGIDPDQCEVVPAPGQSGVMVYFCSVDGVIICSVERDD